MKDDVFVESQPLSDYETERGKPMPTRIHGTVQSQINFLLKLDYGDNFTFPNELSLATEPPSVPDICVYPIRDLDRRDNATKETEMPITTIEIQSPSQTLNDLESKIWDTYFPAGVKSAWIVVPQLKTISVFTPDNQQFVFSSGMLKDPITDIEISIEKVFERLK